MPSTFRVVKTSLFAVAAVCAIAAPALAQNQRVRIQVGRSHVISTTQDVRTVAIAEPRTADAAVGAERSVIVSGKQPGFTTLVVYTEGGGFTIYDIEVLRPGEEHQVKLHVTVAEVNDIARRQLGFDLLGQVRSTIPWLDGTLTGAFYTTKVQNPWIPLLVGPTTDGFFDYVRSAGDFSLQGTWQMLERRGDIRLLANPTLVANSGDSAYFHSGGEIPVGVVSGTGLQQTITIEWKKYGVQVNFRPIVSDNDVTLRVGALVSQLDFANALTISGGVIPALSSRSAYTTVTLKSGEHLAIGGLKIRETQKRVNRVPVLGQIPILGFFFRQTINVVDERELLLVVSPEIVTAQSTPPSLPTDRPERVR